MDTKRILLCAGGTGGHLFPAEALAHALKERGWSVHLASDKRAARFSGAFPADDIHPVDAATFGSRNPVALTRSALTIWRGVRQSSTLIQKLQPKVVVGFGGYPTLPPLYAATRRGVPTLIHEQNAVMGRANKALAGRVTAIAGGFLPEGEGQFAAKTVITGNPVRPAILEAAKTPYVTPGPGERFHLLVFGGSQGAQHFSQVLPKAIALLSEEQRALLAITQQARPDDEEALRAGYAEIGIEAEVSSFFTDMAERIAKAHLIISRSGASTVSEIAVVGRPAILVPYPHALDHDQAANAAALERAGGAEIVSQDQLTAERLRGILEVAINSPQKLAATAAAAREVGRPNAAALLANLTEAIAAGETAASFKQGVRA